MALSLDHQSLTCLVNSHPAPVSVPMEPESLEVHYYYYLGFLPMVRRLCPRFHQVGLPKELLWILAVVELLSGLSLSLSHYKVDLQYEPKAPLEWHLGLDPN